MNGRGGAITLPVFTLKFMVLLNDQRNETVLSLNSAALLQIKTTCLATKKKKTKQLILYKIRIVRVTEERSGCGRKGVEGVGERPI